MGTVESITSDVTTEHSRAPCAVPCAVRTNSRAPCAHGSKLKALLRVVGWLQTFSIGGRSSSLERARCRAELAECPPGGP
jgi:hypothetical protein